MEREAHPRPHRRRPLHVRPRDRVRAAEARAQRRGDRYNARQAISTARELHPDIVLMDVGLPDQDGVSAGRRILADRSEAKVIVLTGLDDADLARRAIQSGLHGYLLKSASIMELVGSIIGAASGHTVMPERAVRFMAGTPTREDQETLLLEQLTERERQILALLA